jgi:hypothetical protein
MSCCPRATVFIDEAGKGMRIIGFDIHRAFAEAVAWEDGKLRRLGRVDMRRNFLTAVAASLWRTRLSRTRTSPRQETQCSESQPSIRQR